MVTELCETFMCLDPSILFTTNNISTEITLQDYKRTGKGYWNIERLTCIRAIQKYIQLHKTPNHFPIYETDGIDCLMHNIYEQDMFGGQQYCDSFSSSRQTAIYLANLYLTLKLNIDLLYYKITTDSWYFG